ncbi:homoserine kinase [Serpentinicella sp. ANB-PHB4]|uniref:homoserine kinase n=1 Tax=Serpentinicella sp. ANB-PHB4 TaxID=3074076 RepID=UPI0028597081|nr:homoserine kinase [Serpentinicella sp. ANB-PHB4]MDR5659150.1 homoserine kinase [Serpentinicella sp. ANB-PHB4]
MIKVTVPATTANMGPGFDCLGMALSLYNIIEVKEIEKGLCVEVEGIDKEVIEVDERNLVYICMKKVFEKVGYNPKGLSIKQYNNIPVSRGLGSSAACIVGGLLAANMLCGEPLTKDDLLELAVEIEGHPDNVAPAMFGGFIVSNNYVGKRTSFIKTEVNTALQALVAIPKIELSTKASRAVLPEYVSFKEAKFNIGNTALLVAAMMSGQYDKIEGVFEDKIHQPYRLKLMEDLEKVFIKSKKIGFKHMFLSGAGPTIINLSWQSEKEKIEQLKESLKDMTEVWELSTLNVDNIGARVEYLK